MSRDKDARGKRKITRAGSFFMMRFATHFRSRNFPHESFSRIPHPIATSDATDEHPLSERAEFINFSESKEYSAFPQIYTRFSSKVTRGIKIEGNRYFPRAAFSDSAATRVTYSVENQPVCFQTESVREFVCRAFLAQGSFPPCGKRGNAVF